MKKNFYFFILWMNKLYLWNKPTMYFLLYTNNIRIIYVIDMLFKYIFLYNLNINQNRDLIL